MSTVVLETKNLSHIYGKGTNEEVVAIKNANLKINKGEIVGIIGHTGSGKSTLVQHFNGLLEPDCGTVLLLNKDIWQNKKEIRSVRFKVGLCFQYPEYQLFEETVFKDISFGPKNMGQTEDEIKQSVKRAMQFVGLDESYLDQSPFDLSGGEKRRVAIAGVMAMNPEVLVLDEPSAGLDPRGRDQILSMIKDYNKKTGATVLLVSHSMEDISVTAEKIIVVNNSEIAFFDTVNNVFSHSEELTKMGLDVPDITKLFLKLKNEGVDVRTNIYTIKDAKDEILRVLKSNKR